MITLKLKKNEILINNNIAIRSQQTSCSKNSIQVSCDFLESSMKSHSFAEQFPTIGKDKSDTIIVVDTNSYFDGCGFRILDKVIFFERTLVFSPNKRTTNKIPNTIVVLSLKKNSKYAYEIRFWNPDDNATLTLELRKQKSKIQAITKSRGSF